jgi:hypothetical protein
MSNRATSIESEVSSDDLKRMVQALLGAAHILSHKRLNIEYEHESLFIKKAVYNTFGLDHGDAREEGKKLLLDTLREATDLLDSC